MTARGRNFQPVRLRSVREADIELFFQHQVDPEAIQMGGYDPRPREEHLDHWLTLLADPSVNARTITVADVVAGHASAWTDGGKRQVGYVVGRQFWGGGVATAAVQAFLSAEPERPLWAFVASHNAASLRVLAKCGFHSVAERPPEAHNVAYVALTYGRARRAEDETA